jgi:hypothetical protein
MQMTKPLLDLLKKEFSFEWKKEQQNTFKDLKEKLSFAHVSKFRNFIKAFKLHIDVSDFAIGRVFMQEGQLIVFKSKQLCGTQLRWPTHVCCLKTWQHCLGTHKTKIFTNNVSLKYFETQRKALMKQLK